MTAAEGHGRRLPRLVFIGGVASGGTDLLRNVVNAHRQIDMPLEFPFLAEAAATLGPTVPADDLGAAVKTLRRIDAYHNFKRAEISLPSPEDGRYTTAEIYVHMLGGVEGAAWTGNKTPTNTENMAALRWLFPDARFLLIARDPRDVALSWERKWGKDKVLAAHKWNARMLKGLAMAARLPADDVLVVSYEDLLDDLESVSRQICAFLELPFDDRMLSFEQHVPHVVEGKFNFGAPIVRGNSGKWRESIDPRLVRRVEEIAWDGMRALGYEISAAAGPRPITPAEVVRGRLRDAWATIAVGNRAEVDQRYRKRALQAAFELRKALLMRHARG